jgi:hypothetical protein
MKTNLCFFLLLMNNFRIEWNLKMLFIQNSNRIMNNRMDFFFAITKIYYKKSLLSDKNSEKED